MGIRNKNFSMAIVFFVLLVSSALGAQAIGIISATVINPPFIYVDSPQTGRTYFSNEIQLNFTIVPNMGSNFTSFSYTLDGQANQTTNGNTILTGLSPGTHALLIYGKGTYLVGNSVHDFRYPLEVVYFSVFFSTESVILAIVIGAVFLIIGLTLLRKRKQLARALRGKKTASFWLGLVSFFLAILFFAPSLWQIAYEYYFWYYSRDVNTSLFTGISIVLGSIFICIGLYLMRAGTKSKLISENQ